MVRIKHSTDTDTITAIINGQVLIINQIEINPIAATVIPQQSLFKQN